MFQGVDPHSLLPAQFVGIWRHNQPVPGHAVNHLRVHQVDVDGVRIHAVVRNLPDLGSIIQAANWLAGYRRFPQVGQRAEERVEQEGLVCSRALVELEA